MYIGTKIPIINPMKYFYSFLFLGTIYIFTILILMKNHRYYYKNCFMKIKTSRLQYNLKCIIEI